MTKGRDTSTRVLVLAMTLAMVISLSIGCASPPPPAPTQAPPAAPAATKAPPAPAATAQAKPTQATAPAASPTSAPAAAKPAAPKPSTQLPPKPAGEVTIKVGLVGLISDVGVFVAQDKGYFKEQGLNVVVEKFDSSVQMLAPLATGQVDVAVPTPDAGLFNAVARGLDMRVVADKGSMPPGFGFNAFVVRKDLVDSVKDYKDLKGKIVGRLEGTGQDIVVDKALKKGGLTTSDVELIHLPIPDMVPALANKKADVALVIEPFVAIAQAQGAGKMFKTADDVYPNQQISVITYSPQFAVKKDGTPQRWMVAYLKAVRDYNDAFVKNKGKDEVVKSLIKNTAVKQAPLYDQMIPAGINPDGYVNTKGMIDDLGWWMEKGIVKEKIDVNKLVDNSFVDYAVSVLGKYQR
ncbi:MAG: ABC transporter substrate-binding protein [Chloroflexi bacterium]|nr:ABC transporter substrate-binding protein [Chloroflexota bacterium]